MATNISTLLTLGTSALCFASTYYFNKGINNVEETRKKLFENIVDLENLDKQPDNKKIIVQFTPESRNGIVGILCLHKQEIVNKTEYVPGIEIFPTKDNNPVRLVAIIKPVNVFLKCATIFKDSTFKTNILVPIAKFDVNYFNLGELAITDQFRGDVQTIKEKLESKYGIKFHDYCDGQIYEYTFHSLNNKPIYFIGTKIKNRFYYEKFTTDPQKIIHYVLSNESFLYNFGRFASASAGVGCLVAPIMSRL